MLTEALRGEEFLQKCDELTPNEQIEPNNQNKGPTRPMIDLKPVFSRRSRLIA
jgi:hypothetical protein